MKKLLVAFLAGFIGFSSYGQTPTISDADIFQGKKNLLRPILLQWLKVLGQG